MLALKGNRTTPKALALGLLCGIFGTQGALAGDAL